MAVSSDRDAPVEGERKGGLWSLFGTLVWLLLFMGGVVYGVDYLSRDLRYVVKLERVVPTAAAGAAMPARDEALDPMLEARSRWTIFDGDLTTAVRQAYEGSPWVRGVSVKRRFPGTVEVGLELVQPLAWAEWSEDQYVLVAKDGEILPTPANPPELAAPLIRTTSILREATKRRRIKDEDTAWFAAAVKEGASVINDLTDHAWLGVFESLRIDAVDVSNFGGRVSANEPEVLLATDYRYIDPATRTKRPVVIFWGRSTQHPRGPIEIAPKKKLENLELVLRSNPGLRNVGQIDLRFDAPVWRPVPTAPTAETAGEETGDQKRSKPR